MKVKSWSEIFIKYGKSSPVRLGQVSHRRAAATYKQIEDQHKENKKRYKEPNGLHVKYRGENV